MTANIRLIGLQILSYKGSDYKSDPAALHKSPSLPFAYKYQFLRAFRAFSSVFFQEMPKFRNDYPHFYLVRKFLPGVRLGFSLFAPALKGAGKSQFTPFRTWGKRIDFQYFILLLGMHADTHYSEYQKS